MKDYSLSKKVVKRHVLALIGFSYLFTVMLYNLMDHVTSGFQEWSTIVPFLGIIGCIYLVIHLSKGIYEPALKISDAQIEIKIDQDYNFWQTTWANLSHIETRMERIANTGNRQYEYVCFKIPVTRDISFLGLKLWKTSRKGFRLDILEKAAREEIKARLS